MCIRDSRLVVDRKVIEWDFASNPKLPPEERIGYMLFGQMSKMTRAKFAIRHDDRLDCLAQGVKYFTDCLAISALEQIKLRKQLEWDDMIQGFLDDPQASANHLVMGMNYKQRQEARGQEIDNNNTWA